MAAVAPDSRFGTVEKPAEVAFRKVSRRRRKTWAARANAWAYELPSHLVAQRPNPYQFIALVVVIAICWVVLSKFVGVSDS